MGQPFFQLFCIFAPSCPYKWYMVWIWPHPLLLGRAAERQMSMKAKLFLKNTVILTVGSIILRLIGVAFGAYLSRQIGAEGMGLYQLVFSVYNFASTLATSGIYLSVTRLVAEGIGRGSYADANDAMRKCMIYGVIVSTVAASALYGFSVPIGTKLLDDPRTVLSLRILACALPFMAFSSSLRGYFFAIRNVVKSTSSQILEQLVRMAVVSAGLTILLPKGMTWACAAIALGSVGGEALAFLYTLVLYLRDRRKRNFTPKRQKETTRKVLSITIPVALSSYLRSALVTIENILIPRGFKKYGATGQSALAQYGMMEAMVMPILTFPSAFLTSFSSLLVPELAEAAAMGNRRQINRLASRVMQLTLFFSLPITAAFIAFGEDLGLAVYQSAEAGAMLRVLAPLVPMLYLDTVADAMLKGLDEQVSSLRYSIIDSAISVVLIYLLIPIYGVNGYIAVMFISTFVNAALSINCLVRVTEIPFSLGDWVIKPIIAVTASSIGVLYLVRGLTFSSHAIAVVVKAGLMLLCYFGLLLLTRAVTFREIRDFRRILHPKDQKPRTAPAPQRQASHSL